MDDGFALALAHADPDIHLEMITTVNGNTDVDSATILTGLLMARLGIKVPLYTGSATPFIRPNQRRRPDPSVLSLCDAALSPTPGYAPLEIIKYVLANPGEITLVAIGPLTNVAIALSLEPKIAHAIKKLVVMGGIFNGSTGRREQPGETNVYTDPEAAQCVLRSGIRQLWVGMDVSTRTRMTRSQAEEMQESTSPFGALAGAAAIKYIDLLAQRFPRRPTSPDSCHLHDPLAVAVLSHPEFCEFEDAQLSVVTGEGEARGMVITDRLEGYDPPIPNCSIATKVDVQAFQSYFFQSIGTL